MTTQDEYARALEGQATARRSIRDLQNDDALLDHWAERLVFWRAEAKRLAAPMAAPLDLGPGAAAQPFPGESAQ